MKIENILLIGIMFMMPLFSEAQEQEEGWFRCGTDSVYDEMVRHNPQIALNRAKLKDFVREYVRQNPTDMKIVAFGDSALARAYRKRYAFLIF